MSKPSIRYRLDVGNMYGWETYFILVDGEDSNKAEEHGKVFEYLKDKYFSDYLINWSAAILQPEGIQV